MGTIHNSRFPFTWHSFEFGDHIYFWHPNLAFDMWKFGNASYVFTPAPRTFFLTFARNSRTAGTSQLWHSGPKSVLNTWPVTEVTMMLALRPATTTQHSGQCMLRKTMIASIYEASLLALAMGVLCSAGIAQLSICVRSIFCAVSIKLVNFGRKCVVPHQRSVKQNDTHLRVRSWTEIRDD